MQVKRFTLYQMTIVMSVLIINFILFSGCGTPESTTATPVQTYEPDTLMGDWEGQQILSDGKEFNLVAQVIAYDSGNYTINLMNKFDTRDPLLAELEGHMNNSSVTVSGSGPDGRTWEGSISGNLFKGNFSGTSRGTFQLKKIIRLSPTLGKKPPDGAIVLFNGTDFKSWKHQKDPTGYINLARLLGGKNCVAYLQSDLWSDRDQQKTLRLRSSDPLKIWLNSEAVHVNDKGQNAEEDREECTLNLKKGLNKLLLKVANREGRWGVFTQLNNADGISESDLSSAQNEGTAKYLEKNQNSLTQWEVSGPYRKENMSPRELLDVQFDPELATKVVDWKTVNIDTIDNAVKWDLIDGAMQVAPGTGSIMTRQKFNNFQMHLEFRSPFMPGSKGQARGNSGVYLQGRYEVQVLDSYGLEGMDNECGGIYKVARPLVNMCAPPTQWQTYDVDFRAAIVDQNGNKLENPRLTLLHNGVMIYNNLEIPVPTDGGLDKDMSKPGPLFLQDHNDLVQYRNIWLIEM